MAEPIAEPASVLPEECLEPIPDEELLYDLADLFKVFSDTTRIKILYCLMDAERCVADIAEVTGSTQSAVSHQLRILKQARLVRFRREGRNSVYSLADDHVNTMLSQGMTHSCELGSVLSVGSVRRRPWVNPRVSPLTATYKLTVKERHSHA